MLKEITKEGNALLMAIRNSESSKGDEAYNMRYSPKGGAKFYDYSKHPNIREAVPRRKDGKTSDAAGAYQFLSSTWNPIAKQYGIGDFAPPSQDKGAWILAQRDFKARTGEDLQQALETGQLDKVFAGLAGTWTSLPYGAEKNSLTDKAAETYKKALGGVSGVYGSIRKAGCETRNAVLSTVPFIDYQSVDCVEQYNMGTGTGTGNEVVPEQGGYLENIGLRIGFAIAGLGLISIGFMKLRA